MPCLNEAETLGACIAKAMAFLSAHHVDGEVLIADNGSADGSQEIAERLGARVIAVEERGYGSALRAGIAAARGRYVAMGDADDSYDFGGSRAVPGKLREGYDLVMGNRFRGGISPKRHAAASSLSRQSRADRDRTPLLSDEHRRLPLWPSRLPTRGDSRSRPAHDGDGVRQRDGRQVRTPRPPGDRGPDDSGHPTAAVGRRIFGAGAMAGGTFASCCSTARAGCSSIPAWY